MNHLTYLITQKTIILNYKGTTKIFHQGDENFSEVLNLIRKGDETALIDTFMKDVSKIIIDKVPDGFKVVNGILYATSDRKKIPVPTNLARKLVELAKLDLPVNYLERFWSNLRLNPSLESVEQLFGFLDANNHPLTEDGCFIAYKKVNSRKIGNTVEYWDTYSGTVKYELNKVVSMNRNDVDPNREVTCSTGLHVASWQYANNFHGDVLIEVKVNPKDVVAVPPDYDQQKMRVCALTFIGFAAAERKTPTVDTKKDSRILESKSKIIQNLPILTRSSTKAEVISWLDSYHLKTAKQIVAEVSNYTRKPWKINESQLKSKKVILRQAEKIVNEALKTRSS